MLDLTAESVTGWLQAIQPTRTDTDWPPPIRLIEVSPEAERLFDGLGQALSQHQIADGANLLVALSDQVFLASFRAVLAQMGAARMLRVIAMLADTLPDGAMALIQREFRDTKTADGRALGAALDAVARTTLRGRLTAESKLATLALAVERIAEEAP